MDANISLHLGQQQAQTHWGTHQSGFAFGRKKTMRLTDQAHTLLAQQACSLLAGPVPLMAYDVLQRSSLSGRTHAVPAPFLTRSPSGTN